MSDLVLRQELLALQDEYIATLDTDALELWPEMFVDDCLYEIIPKENEDLGLPAPVIHCDSKAMLRDRVVSLRNANIFQPVVYRHFVSGLAFTAADGVVDMRSSYLVINTSQLGQSVVYQTGRYHDVVVRDGGRWRFRSKRVIYDTSRIQTALAIPI
ncbi:MAG TPA: anthranilate 1,2-dioxygenase small subunit AndAd [Caulobacteraceae bacterium]|nr:anthranilate 1,2-dioxygenase small subunit AndAd [Caulobacteraceae bacterium]